MPKPDAYSDWLDTVAHDLRTPLNLVQGCLDVIEKMGPLNQLQQKYVDRAFAGLRRMEHLISRLRDISWVDSEASLAVSQVDLHSAVAEVVEMLQAVADDRSIQIMVEIQEGAASVYADRIRLTQVLDNLISNAIKYNHDSGQIRIVAQANDAEIVVGVHDNGIGIASDELAHVFERFYRAQEGLRLKIEGSGLGLSITQGIVERHGGRIWVESELGVGTSFYFTLPSETNLRDGRKENLIETTPTITEPVDKHMVEGGSTLTEVLDAVDDNLQERQEINHPDAAGDES